MISESDVEKLFFFKVRTYLLEENRRNEIHLTDLASPCYRKVYWEKKDPFPESPENALRLWKGKMLHELKLLSFHELELEFEGVKTRIDEYSDEWKIFIEKKTTDFIPADLTQLKKYYEHYINQIGFEWLFLVKNGYDVRQAFLLFIRLGHDKDKLVKVFDVTQLINLDEYENKFYTCKERLENILRYDQLPEIPDTFTSQDYPCSYCKYAARCW